MRQVGHRAGKNAFILTVSIKQTPVTSHSTFACAFPRLVERFYQVVFPAILFCQSDKAANELGFVYAAWQGCFTLATFTWPAGFTNQDVFGGELISKNLANLCDVLYGLINSCRVFS